MQRKNSFRLGLLASALILTQGVWALGLGKLTVQSPLGHPLKAQIELMGTNDEFTNLSANIASPTVYQTKDLVYQGALSGTRVVVQQRPDGTAFLNITSNQPIHEPYIDLLIEVSWPAGHALREYTVLLDPPNVKPLPKPAIVRAESAGVANTPPPAPPAPVVAAAPVPPPPRMVTPPPTQQVPVQTQPIQRSRPVATPLPGSQAVAVSPTPISQPERRERPTEPGSYRVVSGDTLTAIAEMYKPEEITLQQALVALYEANPQAFSHENMNNLRAGVEIRIPDAAGFATRSRSEARQIVSVQTSEWRAYRAQLADNLPQAGTTEDQAGGTIRAPEVAETKAPGDGRLSVSAGGGTQQSGAGSDAGGAATTNLNDQLTAMKKAYEEEESRRKELEATLAEQKRLFELQSEKLADLQRQIAMQNQPASIPAPTPAPMPTPETSPMPTPAPMPTPEVTPEPTPVPVATPEPEPPKPTPAPRPAPTPPPQPEFSLLGWIMDNLLTVGAGLLGIVLIISFFIYRRRRTEEDSDSMFTEVTESSAMTASSTSLSTRGSVAPSAVPPRDRGSSSVQSSNSILSEFSRDVDNMVTGEVDPLAEADVYLAYGRAQQAEEILQDALKKNGQRQDIFVKLLEVLADQKKTADFEATANRLYALCNGQGDYWQRAKVLGQRLLPNNPRFAESAPPAPVAPATPSMIVGGHQVDPSGFSAMETPSVAQSIARAASRSVERRAQAGEMTQSALDSPSLLSEMSEVQFSLEPDPDDDLGVDLDLEELSRFRNFGKNEEQVAIDTETPKAEAPAKSDVQQATESFPPMTGETEGPWDDVATKLDLARAYQATGDAEACREILQEVLKEGDEQQKDEARAILKSL